MASSSGIIALVSGLCQLCAKVLDIVAAKGKTNDKDDRINKYTSVTNKLFEDDKSNKRK